MYVNPILGYMQVSMNCPLSNMAEFSADILRYEQVSGEHTEQPSLQQGQVFSWLEYMLTLFYAICRFWVNGPLSNMAEFSSDWNIC